MAATRRLLMLAGAALATAALARQMRRSPAQRRIMQGTGELFETLASTRGTRIFHPLGGAWTGTFIVDPGLPRALHTPLLEPGAERRATVRYSRGLGLPEPLPDFLGIAVRLEGDGERQDLLFTTALPITPTINLLMPARRLQRRHTSSVLPVRINDETCVPGCVQEGSADGSRPDLRLTVAMPGQPTLDLGRIELASQLPEEESRQLAFNPWNTSTSILPVGFFNRLRLPAYEGSQQGRPQSGHDAT